MHVMITGSAGMLGKKLAASLAAGALVGGKAIELVTLVDVITSAIPEAISDHTSVIACDFSGAGIASTLIESRPDVIFHLAAVVNFVTSEWLTAP